MKGPRVADPDQQLIALRNMVGKDVGQIIKELPPAGSASYAAVREALNRKFLPKRNTDYERYTFNLASQEKDEAMGDFITRLKRLARYCEFDNFTTEDAIRLRIKEGCQCESLRRRLLKKHHSVDDIEELTRINDQAQEHAKKMEAGKTEKREQAFRLCSQTEPQYQSNFKKSLKNTSHDRSGSKNSNSRKQPLQCYRCGQDYPHNGPCPAIGKQCHRCGKDNHFETVCQTYRKESAPTRRNPGPRHHARAVRERRDRSTSSSRSSTRSHVSYQSRRSSSRESSALTPISQDSDEYVCMVADPDRLKKYPRLHIRMGNHPAKFVLDTGASLNQRHIVAYASHSLTDTEEAYSQPEKESLAVVWACEHFHLFIYGKHFTLITDHQALISIFGNPRAKMPPRIERWGICLQEYTYTIVHKPGKAENPTDYISRHPRTSTRTRCSLAEEYLHFVIDQARPPAVPLEAIIEATAKDSMLQNVLHRFHTNSWRHLETSNDETANMQELASFRHVKDDLTVSTNGLLLRDRRIVIPQQLRQGTANLAHEGHRGVVATKKALRERVWFPSLDQMVETTLQDCPQCQLVGREEPHSPLQMSDLPDGVWQQVAIDFFGPLKSGKYIIVIMDEYSRFPITQQVPSTRATAVIPVIDEAFAAWGIPTVVKTDNGPPFNGHEFTEFARHLNFKHRIITPMWP